MAKFNIGDEVRTKAMTIDGIRTDLKGVIYSIKERSMWFREEDLELVDGDRCVDNNLMPKLETGMFIIFEDEYNGVNVKGVVVGDKIVYKDGDFDLVDDVEQHGKDGIKAIYDSDVESFDFMNEHKPIWERKD